MQRATCSVCNVQHACDEPSLLRPHGVCVIIFPTAPSEFCIISIYKLFQRVGKSCTNKGRKNPTRSIKKKKQKKPSPSQAPQTENLISQLISIWNNLELQQIRSRAEGGKAVWEAKDAVGATVRARAKGLLKQSRAEQSKRHLWHSKSFCWGIVRSLPATCHMLSGAKLCHSSARRVGGWFSVCVCVWAWLGLPRVA